MADLNTRLHTIQQRIHQAEARYGRQPGSVTLLAVSKMQSLSAMREAALAGQRAFGENYLQEALTKIEALQDLPIEWHFIGDIQRNKTKMVAEQFAWVHSLTRLQVAERLQAQRPLQLPPLNVCIEVNIDDEKTKAGVLPNAVLPLAQAIQSLDRLRLRGLMAIPKPRQDMAQQRRAFENVAELQRRLIAEGLDVDTLSMGMSHDFETAIAAGSTIVRIGTAIFGSRVES